MKLGKLYSFQENLLRSLHHDDRLEVAVAEGEDDLDDDVDVIVEVDGEGAGIRPVVADDEERVQSHPANGHNPGLVGKRLSRTK